MPLSRMTARRTPPGMFINQGAELVGALGHRLAADAFHINIPGARQAEQVRSKDMQQCDRLTVVSVSLRLTLNVELAVHICVMFAPSATVAGNITR